MTTGKRKKAKNGITLPRDKYGLTIKNKSLLPKRIGIIITIDKWGIPFPLSRIKSNINIQQKYEKFYRRIVFRYKNFFIHRSFSIFSSQQVKLRKRLDEVEVAERMLRDNFNQ